MIETDSVSMIGPIVPSLGRQVALGRLLGDVPLAGATTCTAKPRLCGDALRDAEEPARH
jgi:hypothetical protein